MFRRLVFLSLIVALAPGVALGAKPTPAPAVPAATAPPADTRAHDGGMIDGRITAVDFQRNVISVDSARGRIDVQVMPTTSIQGKDPGYRAISDLRAGERVEIFSSVSAGKFIAQIIKIL